MQRLNHHHLFIFWTLARAGTFTNAARDLSIAQSAVTSQIKQLEEVLGLTLIDRSNRRKPELTEDGRRVLDFANAIFESSQELLKWATQGEAPKATVIRVGAISGLSRNLQFEFLRPIIGNDLVKVEVTTGDQDNLVRLLKDHSLDVILSSHNVRAEGAVPFYSHVLTASPLVFVRRQQDRSRRSADLKTLLQKVRLYIPGRSFEIRPELDAFLEGLKFPVRVAGEVDDIALLRIFALRSDAIVAVPQMGVQADLDSKDLSVVGKAAGIEQRFYAIARQKRVPNSTVASLIRDMHRGRRA